MGYLIFRAIASAVLLFILIIAAYLYFKGPAENHGTVQIPAGQATEPSEQLTSINHGSDSTKTVDESIKSKIKETFVQAGFQTEVQILDVKSSRLIILLATKEE